MQFSGLQTPLAVLITFVLSSCLASEKHQRVEYWETKFLSLTEAVRGSDFRLKFEDSYSTFEKEGEELNFFFSGNLDSVWGAVEQENEDGSIDCLFVKSRSAIPEAQQELLRTLFNAGSVIERERDACRQMTANFDQALQEGNFLFLGPEPERIEIHMDRIVYTHPYKVSCNQVDLPRRQITKSVLLEVFNSANPKILPGRCFRHDIDMTKSLSFDFIPKTIEMPVKTCSPGVRFYWNENRLSADHPPEKMQEPIFSMENNAPERIELDCGEKFFNLPGDKYCRYDGIKDAGLYRMIVEFPPFSPRKFNFELSEEKSGVRADAICPNQLTFTFQVADFGNEQKLRVFKCYRGTSAYDKPTNCTEVTEGE